MIYFTVLTLFVEPGMLQQLMAQEHKRKQHLRLFEARARAVRTHINPILSVSRQQEILCYKQLKNSKKALADIKTGKDAKSLVKDISALQGRLKAIHIDLHAELTEMRSKLIENEISQEILDRFGGFKGMANQPLQRFLEVKGVGARKIIRVAAAFEIAKRVVEEVLREYERD